MKRFSLLASLLLIGCVETTSPPQETRPQPEPVAQQSSILRSPEQGVANYVRVAARVEPVAETVCRQFSQNLPPSFCDFNILVDRDPRKPPNAFQSIGSDGRPTLTFTISMLQTVKNDHEIGFILGHEAGHQIARHLLQRRDNIQAGAVLGALLGGVLVGDPNVGADLGGFAGARAYSKEFETEADRLGAHIAYRAGYDPLIGARSFERTGGSNSFLSTHPPGPRRYQTVVDEMAYIRSNGGRRAPIRW